MAIINFLDLVLTYCAILEILRLKRTTSLSRLEDKLPKQPRREPKLSKLLRREVKSSWVGKRGLGIPIDG